MASHKHNPERRSWKGRSYKKGAQRVRTLRDKDVTKHDNRVYHTPVPKYADVMTVEDWYLAAGCFVPYDGSGYWAKDGKESSDSVFNSKPEDATHVAWYNK